MDVQFFYTLKNNEKARGKLIIKQKFIFEPFETPLTSQGLPLYLINFEFSILNH